MQAVDKKWYIIYRWFSLGAGLLTVAYASIGWFAPGLVPLADSPTLSYFTGALALAILAYSIFFYDRVAAGSSHWEAMFILVMIQATTIFSIAQSTGQMSSYVLIWWALAAFMSGIFGIYGTGGSAFITVAYFILTATDAQGKTHYDLREMAVLVGLLLLCAVSQFFWRRHYVSNDTEQVAFLSGQLKTNQKQSEILVQSLNDGVLLVNTEGAITLMNPAAAKMTGWTVEEGTGADCQLVVNLKQEDGSELEKSENPLSDITHTREPATNTVQLVSRKSKAITISLVTSPVFNAKTQQLVGSVIVMRDISVSRQSEKQRAEFISTASHEMRTPVAAIEGYLQLALNEKVSKIDPKAREFLGKALDSTHHLGQLFQDLLTSAKAEDGRLVSHPTVVEMGAYIEQLAESFRFSAEKKGLLTDFVFGQSSLGVGSQAGEHVIRPLYYVHIDPDRLREVVTNIFDNAVKYTPSGKISLGLTGNTEVVQIFIRDTGPGIAAEDVPHLFQKFYRVDNSTTRTIGGTGLGLFISRKIIELYHGRIWVESEIGKGSTFYINLPRITTQKAEELKSIEAQSVSSRPINSLTTPV